MKEHMYISDPRHPTHHLFLKATNTVVPKKADKGMGGKGAVNVLARNRPKHSYVLSENIYRI